MLRDMLLREGVSVGRRHVVTLMKRMGIEALYRRPNTSKAAPGHRIYPYLLRGVTVGRTNQAWATDITYIPMAQGWVYLVAIIDWFSLRVLAHRLSITMEADFGVEALEEALTKHGKPEIFNTDQGSQFSSEAFTGVLDQERHCHQHGRQGFLARQCIRREVLAQRQIRGSSTCGPMRTSAMRAPLSHGIWTSTIRKRPHSSLDRHTPNEVYFNLQHPAGCRQLKLPPPCDGCDFGRATPSLRHIHHTAYRKETK